MVPSNSEPVEPVDLPESLPDPVPEVEIDEISVDDNFEDEERIDDDRVSLLMKNAELEDVIEVFGQLSNANIIVPNLSSDTKVDRTIDVNLSNVEWKPALEAILESQDLELYEKIVGSEIYSVRTKTPGAPEPMEMKIFKLNYASASSVTNLLAQMVGASGTYSSFPERNVVMAQTFAKNLRNIEALIEQIDLPRQQVFIEAKFMELTDTARKDLGINWQVLQSYGVGVNGIGGDYAYGDSRQDNFNRSMTDQDKGNYTTRGTIDNNSAVNNYNDIAGKSYERLEEAPDQTWVSDENNPGNFEWDNGVDYAQRPGGLPANGRIYGITPTASSENSTKNFSDNLTEVINDAIVGSGSLDASTVTRTLGATLSAADFQLVLSALERRDGVDIVSNPKIIVANEEKASIHIGKVKPRYETELVPVNDTQSKVVIKQVGEYRDGVSVDVTPTINTADNITLKIVPKLERLDITPDFRSSEGIPYYGKTVKTIDTVFSLESGQTAAIGGLTQVTDSTTKSKIPLLGDLPFLGRFFSYEQDIKEQNETIIFVTVGIANPSSIDMETGLPEDARLVQRYQIRNAASRQVSREELVVFETKEKYELEEELERLREANRKLIEEKEAEKEAAKKAKEAAAEEAALVEEFAEEEPEEKPDESGEEVEIVAEVIPSIGVATNVSTNVTLVVQEDEEEASDEEAVEEEPAEEVIPSVGLSTNVLVKQPSVPSKN